MSKDIGGRIVPDHVARMIEERDQLTDRFEKLREFINKSPIFATLRISDQELMVKQRLIMRSYIAILNERIERALA